MPETAEGHSTEKAQFRKRLNRTSTEKTENEKICQAGIWKAKNTDNWEKKSQLKTKLELKENTSVQTEAPPGRAPRPYFNILGAKNFPKQNTFRILRR